MLNLSVVFDLVSDNLMGKNKFLRKFTEWEYWPSTLFYTPNIPYALYLGLKAGNFAFYTAVNPGIKSSGNGTESKFNTLKMIPDELKPKSILVSMERNWEDILGQIKTAGIKFPLIAKPDVGFRGMFVKKIRSEEQLKTYLDQHPFNIIIQDFISLPHECGVFFHKLPESKQGHITSLTLKSYIQITGDGQSTVSELVHRDKRAKHYIEKLQEINQDIWDTVPSLHKELILSEIGNHGRGTQFFNGNDQIDAQLEQTFNELSAKIPGFYYGRFDIKYQSLEELKQGKNFKFLEVNGIISEPTHMYDAQKGTYFGALKTIRKHWDIVYLIGTQNHKMGVPYMKISTFWKEISGLMKYVNEMKKLAHSV